MLQPLRDISIKRKLITIIMFTTTLSLFFANITFIYLDRNSLQKSMQQELKVLGTVVAQRSAIAIAFRDKKAVSENLNSLAAKDSIELACMYDREGKLFSRYLNKRNSVNNNELMCPEYTLKLLNTGFNNGFLETLNSINYNKKTAGGLYLKTNTQELDDHLYEYAKLSSITIVIILIFTLFLSSYLQRYISHPILSLSKLALQVKETNDFSLRLKRNSNDEVGHLIDSFNGMLAMIEEAKARIDDIISGLKIKKEKSDANAISAEQKSKAVSEFFAGASHDLRQPLHAMGIFSDALLDSNLQKSQYDLANKLSLSIENMSSLFTDLLDISKLDADLPKANIQPVKLNEIIEKLNIDFMALATEKGLILEIDDSDIIINTDKVMLERILRNLTSNAVRYTAEGKIHISTCINDHNTIIKIKDTGIGIAKEKQTVIFDTYTQVETQNDIGLGLGLSIVKKLSHALKVKINLESDLGKGSCFSVIIPNAPIEAQNIEHSPIEKNVYQTPYSSLTFLVIDDEEDILQAMEMLLIQWGAKVISATSLEQAIEKLNTAGICPAMLITDYNLQSDATGFDAITAVHEFLDEEIPSLIITGNTKKEDLIFFNQHNQTVLYKPLKPAALRASISQLLGI
ncbi:MAG: signal transduction histidine kinase [Granulosicoccus sp.]|jgi:signal transduction histidine kinase